MLDPKLLRNQLDEVATKLARRGFVVDIECYRDLEAKRKSYQHEVETLQSERNQASKQIGIDKAAGLGIESATSHMKQVSADLKEKEQLLQEVQQSLSAFVLALPNLPSDDTPVGSDESDNAQVRTWGKPREFDFEPKDHLDLGVSMKMMDPERASKMSRARFMVLRQKLAKLHRVIGQFMLDFHIENHGYEEMYTPYLVNRDSLLGTGQLPKMEEDLFHIKDFDLALIPTAEVSLTNYHRDEILLEKDLPRKFVALTPCFRSEAGSYGKDTKGMIRQHQFEKVELVQIVSADQAQEAHEGLTHHAESILQALDLPYQLVQLCSGDLGFSACKTYDLEVWLPGQGAYREISSCSHFGDFQTRRSQIRVRSDQSNKPVLAHTINGSGLAVGRTLVAIIENYQQEDGSIKIPEALVAAFGEDCIRFS